MPVLGPNSVLIDDNLSSIAVSYLFENPIEIICANKLAQIDPALAAIEVAIKANKHVAGFFSYELGYYLEPNLWQYIEKYEANAEVPLLWFGVYDNRTELTKAETSSLIERAANGPYQLFGPQYSLSPKDYETHFEQIHSEICKGTIYQANFTFRANYDFRGNIFALYRELRESQKTSCGALINMEGKFILSRSPEVFFKKSATEISALPMKGTIARDKNENGDNAQIQKLYLDEKQRAENLMIVDLMRNDLSRISEAGSVKVPELFKVEIYETLFQMVSKINAKLKPKIKTGDIIKALFPCGSITGAPKISAMEQIAIHETEPRGVYCGAIGYFSNDEIARFNVGIRTLLIDKNRAHMGIGSGIVYDSIAQDEYNECLLKSDFINRILPKFGIIETLLWEKGFGFHRLEMHLSRLEKSARELGLQFNLSDLRKIIAQDETQIDSPFARIRIEIANEISIYAQAFTPNNNSMLFAISPTIMHSDNPWLKYKTTNREIYDNEWRTYNKAHGLDEIIYFNERGEITEGSRTNIFIDFGDGQLFTPPISCGLLPGILRQELLDLNRTEEKVLYISDIERAKKIFLGNSLRGLKEAALKSL